MAMDASALDEDRLPAIADPRDFDHRSGSALERVIFNNRMLVVLLCLLATLVLGYSATRLKVNADFDKMIPQSHPFIQNYFAHKDALKGMGNAVRIVVETQRGDVFDAGYLELLRRINDKVYLMPGVDRAMMRSVWMPIVRWTEVTEEGAIGGPVMPPDYDGSARSVEQFRANLLKARVVGDLVGSDFKSTMLVVPLLDKVAETGQPLDYSLLSQMLEREVRDLAAAAPAGAAGGPYKVHIVGFAKLVGDLIAGLGGILGFFAVSAGVATVLIFLYTRDWRSTALLVLTAVMGVVWLLGLLQLLGYDLNPYSILVPFLVFAIGISHGAQKLNGVMQDIGRGTHRYVAARYTFRRLFVAGLTALLTNVVGFAVLMIIDVPVIRDLALATSLGVSILVVTKLFFIPVALSYIGVSPRAARRSLDGGQGSRVMDRTWSFFQSCAQPGRARVLVLASLLLGAAAATTSLMYLRIGDLGEGAPELRPDSRYNRDVSYINAHYNLSTDQFAIITKTPPDGMRSMAMLVEQDRLAWTLQQLPGVIGTQSLPQLARQMTYAGFEGHPKWLTVPRSDSVIAASLRQVANYEPNMISGNYSIAPLVAYLKDHRADTLDQVVQAVEAFAGEHETPERRFLLAAGSAGIEAATNIVVREANYRMLALLYAAVLLLCFITFRSWRAVVVAMVPLLITAFLCEALMVALGIGVKVATLPVIALGVGVGVDYALYLLSIQLAAQRRGMALRDAYGLALHSTGKVVALIGFTMAAGVVTWSLSPIKFQADMGLLLTFMFIWNMLGALALIPALSHFLLRPRAERDGATTGAGIAAAVPADQPSLS